MKFSITNRKLWKMIFDLGDTTQIGGTCKVRRYEQTWMVFYHPASIFRAEAGFTATVTGIYNQEAYGTTLDEVLNALEAMIEEAAA